jgi:hypothetical protein
MIRWDFKPRVVSSGIHEPKQILANSIGRFNSVHRTIRGRAFQSEVVSIQIKSKEIMRGYVQQTLMGIGPLVAMILILTSWQLGLAEEIHVRPGGLNPAVAIKSAKPGDTVLIHPGIYSGGKWIVGIQGTPEKVITVRAADPKSPPVISGGLAGWQFSACSYLVIEDIVFEHQTDNGLNIDDHDQYLSGNMFAATGIRLNRIVVRDLNAEDNNDGIKLSGLHDFTLSDCRISNWGRMGCGIDMVACTDGKILGVIADGCDKGGWGIQAKGGSEGLLIQDCQVRNITQRGIQVGGVTSPGSFREKGVLWEAKDIQIQSCDVYGGDASITIIHAMDVSIMNCRWINPRKWFFRFLNENNAMGFQASRNVLVQGNLCVATGNGFIGPINSGIHWDSTSIRFEGNIWYHETFPKRDLRLGLPSGEFRGVSCVRPPNAFLRKDFAFTKLRHDQLLLLLSDEIPQRQSVERLKWLVIIGSTVLLWIGLWIFSLGSKVDSMRLDRQRVRENYLGRGFLFLLALVFLFLHMDLHLGVSLVDEAMTRAKFDRFELIVRGFSLGGGVVLLLVSFDHFLIGTLDSMWLRFFWGTLFGVSICGIESLNQYRLGRIELDRNHFLIDATTGFFAGVLAHGVTREIRAMFLKLSKRSVGFSSLDSVLWTLVGMALIISSLGYPLGFNAEFLYDRFRSYGANLRLFASPVDTSSLAETVLFCVPLAWGLERIHRFHPRGIFKPVCILIFLVIAFESTNFFRTGRCFSLDQTLLAILLGFLTFVVAKLSSGTKRQGSRIMGSTRMVARFGGLMAVASWVLLFLFGGYL